MAHTVRETDPGSGKGHGATRKRSPSLSDVADAAGVSRTTAAKVLLGTGGAHVRVGCVARERVARAARRLGYRPNRIAQQLGGGASRLLGVLLGTLNKPVMTERLAALERAAAQRGYRLLVGQAPLEPRALAAYLDDFEGRGLDGLVCLFDVPRRQQLALRPLCRRRPDLIAHGRPLTPDGYCVRVDTAAAIRAVVAHLVAGGRRRIGMELWNVGDAMMSLRVDGYLAALAAADLPNDRRLIWADAAESLDPAPETVARAIRRLVDERHADAIIASNDIWAVRFIQRLKARGLRVPEDVAVVGYDNLDIATVIEPPLTTVDQRHDAYAAAIMGILQARLEGHPPRQHVVTITPELVVRASSA